MKKINLFIGFLLMLISFGSIAQNSSNRVFKNLTLKGKLSVEDSVSINGSAYVDSIVDFGDFTYEKHMVGITTVGTSTYSLVATDYILHVTYTATGACTITLPTAQVVSGRTIIIKDGYGNASVNNISIETEASETIDERLTYVISVNYGAVEIYSDGTNWFILNKY